MKKYDICVVGATGLVGQTFLKVLDEYDFPINRLKLLASARSKGKIINYKEKEYIVEELTKDSFEGYELALFSAGGSVSLEFAPYAKKAGLTVIDNSSAWREDVNKALVVPEINIEDALKGEIIANPNCSTIQSVLPLKVLSDEYGLKRVFYSTYQAVSGSGQRGKVALEEAKKGNDTGFYPYDISKTCIPQIDVFLDNGYTKEEIKMTNETRKILHLPNLKVSATCIRVPVANSHGVSMQIELEKAFDLEKVKEMFRNTKGLVLLQDDSKSIYPTSLASNGNDEIYVGRLRRDISCDNGLLLYCTADNIRKGAASNAVQIALAMIEKNNL